MGRAERDPCAVMRALTSVGTLPISGTTDNSASLIVDLEPLGPRVWRFVMANGTKVEVEARLAREWLELRAALPDAHDLDAGRVWALLRQNALFDGSARVALGPDDGLHARAEVWMGEEPDLDVRVEAAATSLSSACHALMTPDAWHGSLRPADEPASTRLAVLGLDASNDGSDFFGLFHLRRRRTDRI